MTISNLTGGYTAGGTNATIGPFGSFEFLIDGPATGGFDVPWFFRISRDAGFFDELAVFERNGAGFFAAANILRGPDENSETANTIGAQVLLPSINPTPVPEPGSMLLLGTGLAAARRARRRHSSC